MPASLQQRGEHCRFPRRRRTILVSIRASLQQRGERQICNIIIANTEFQSAPHFSSEANKRSMPSLRTPLAFQSAPHFSSEANHFSIFDMSFHRWVSIRASLQQRGERQLTAQVLWAKLVSIRASLQQRGELIWWVQVVYKNVVSIRASLQQRGELICWIQSANKYVVSIRASLQQRGEHNCLYTIKQ